MDKGQPQKPRTRPQSFAHSADSDDEAELLRLQACPRLAARSVVAWVQLQLHVFACVCLKDI